MKKKMAWIWALGAVWLGEAGALDTSPIRIGVVAPLSSPSSEDMGLSIVGGAKVFLEDVNTTGGILGRKVELVIRDDQAKPDVGVAMAKELVEKEKVVAIVGFANTGVAMPSAKVMQEAKIPVIISAATGAVIGRSHMPPAVPDSYVFRTSASDDLQPVAILNDAIKRRGLQKIALLHDETPYGQSGKQSVLQELANNKLEPAAVDSFKVGEMDFANAVQKIKASGAQAVVLYALASDAAEIVKRLDKEGLKLPVLGPWTLSQKTFLAKAGKSAEGARTAVTFIENDLSSVKSQFSVTYRRINNVSQIPSGVAAAQTYDALRLLSMAIMQAGATDGTKIRNALENLNHPTTSTVTARYSKPFTPSDHEAIIQSMVVMAEIRNGKLEYAYKEDAASASMLRTKGMK